MRKDNIPGSLLELNAAADCFNVQVDVHQPGVNMYSINTKATKKVRIGIISSNFVEIVSNLLKENKEKVNKNKKEKEDESKNINPEDDKREKKKSKEEKNCDKMEKYQISDEVSQKKTMIFN